MNVLIWILNMTGVAFLLLANEPALASSIEKGRLVYIQKGCWQCHGFFGQGGIAGPALAPGPLPAEAFKSFVRSTNRAMPPYREAVLSNDELDAIYGFVESIPTPPDHNSIRLLND